MDESLKLTVSAFPTANELFTSPIPTLLSWVS